MNHNLGIDAHISRRGLLKGLGAAGLTTMLKPVIALAQEPRSRDDIYKEAEPFNFNHLKEQLQKNPKADVLTKPINIRRELNKTEGVDIAAHRENTSQLRDSKQKMQEQIKKLRIQAEKLFTPDAKDVLSELNQAREVKDRFENSDDGIQKALIALIHRIAVLENAVEINGQLALLHDKSFPNLRKP